MSKIKISENLFLGVAELNKILHFSNEEGYKLALKSIISKFGIVKDENNTYFKVSKNNENTILINPGIAFDKEMNAIILQEPRVIPISVSNDKKWIILSRDTNNYEAGKISITSEGTMIGANTEFTKVLRGQPNFPSRIKLSSKINNEEYEVVSVISDNEVILSGNFAPENNLKYSVIGTFTPGFIPEENNKCIYEYDSCKIDIIESKNKPNVSEDEYVLASVDSNLNVTDERIYSMLNNPFYNKDYSNGENRIVSLLSATVISNNYWKSDSIDVQLILEHGYSISSYKITTDKNYNIFEILIGKCNFIIDNIIPDNLFQGWKLLNRVNMEYSIVDYNIGKKLYISNFNPLLVSDKNDFVLIPNHEQIEYEVALDNTDYPFYFRNSVSNIFSRFRFYLLTNSGNVNVSIRYRFIDSNKKDYPFYSLQPSIFTNTEGEKEVLVESEFLINVDKHKGEKEKENYS